MTTIKKITSKNVEKHVKRLTLKQLFAGTIHLNKEYTSIDPHFNKLGLVAIAGIISEAVGASKLGVAELIVKLQQNKYTDAWTERFVYEDGEWRYIADLEGMGRYELMTIKREIFYKK